MKIFCSIAICAAALLGLALSAEAKSRRYRDDYWGDDRDRWGEFPGKSDLDRDGYISWMEYRDCVRDGSRWDFYRRDRDRDDRLSRDEWRGSRDRDDRSRDRR